MRQVPCEAWKSHFLPEMLLAENPRPLPKSVSYWLLIGWLTSLAPLECQRISGMWNLQIWKAQKAGLLVQQQQHLARLLLLLLMIQTLLLHRLWLMMSASFLTLPLSWTLGMDLLSIPAKHPFLLLLLVLSLSLSLSLSLDRVTYIIPGLFCNNKSLTGSQMLSRKRSLQRSSFGRQRRFPASCSSSSLARSKSTKQSRRRRSKATKRKNNDNNKTKQNKTEQMSETKMQR
jgi:hypothetical protein